MRASYLALAVLAGAASPVQAAPILVDQGNICSITSLGSHQCIWVDEQGAEIGGASVTFGQDPGVKPSDINTWFAINQIFGVAGARAAFDFVTPFTIAEDERGYERKHFGTFRGVYQDFMIRPDGDVSFQAQYSDNVFPGISINDSLFYLRVFEYYQRRDYDSMSGQGNWVASASWNLTRNAVASVYGSSGLAVPEPASWVLLISGFGLAGAALRRRNRINLPASAPGRGREG